ncbi:9084_t:CDS:1 [Dentiscutata heterogama]|uniref:9084_t:CDS:1 n=1 Tax=Dentiscutata heterogama TaxID=1316150 RepID=A0ACA9KE68_9GLOM|nr:9084_t:CDS:1 [Dentiscutata heterogama]
MDSNNRILNPTIQLEKSDENNSSIVTDINSSLTHNKRRNTRLLTYSRQIQADDDDDDEFDTPVNIYREHKNHLEQDKRVRKELDTQIFDDLYEPIQKTFAHNSKFLTSKDGDIPSGDKGIIMTGIWNCNYNGIC